MKKAIVLLILALSILTVTTANGQAPPPPGGPPPQGPPTPLVRAGEQIPLVIPGGRVNREMDVAGENLKRALNRDQSLKDVKRVRIVAFDVPRQPGFPPDLPLVIDYYDRLLGERGWKPLWHNAGQGRPRKVYAGPNANGLISVMVLPRSVIVTHIEGTADLRKMPAIDKLMRGTMQVPREPREEMMEAEGFVRNGQLDRAVESYKRLMAEDPQRPGPYIGLAMIQMRQGKTAEAEANLKKAIQLDPMNANARGQYARLLATKKDWPAAEYEARQAAALAPENSAARMVLAESMEARGMYREAVEQYRLLLRNPVNTAEPYVKLGVLLEKLQRREEAIQSYENALKVEPNRRDARQALARLKK